MSVALSRYPTFTFLALALLCSSLPAHAGPFLATLDDFHPNCDIRQLNLSADQHAALRRLRRLLGQKPAKADLSAVGRADSACLCLLLEILRGSGGQLRGIPAAVRDLADLYEVREWMNL